MTDVAKLYEAVWAIGDCRKDQVVILSYEECSELWTIIDARLRRAASEYQRRKGEHETGSR